MLILCIIYLSEAGGQGEYLTCINNLLSDFKRITKKLQLETYPDWFVNNFSMNGEYLISPIK